MELDDVPVDSLVPAPLQGIASVSDFMALLHEYDDDMAAQLATAEANNECLRFVGALVPARLSHLAWPCCAGALICHQSSPCTGKQGSCPGLQPLTGRVSGVASFSV